MLETSTFQTLSGRYLLFDFDFDLKTSSIEKKFYMKDYIYGRDSVIANCFIEHNDPLHVKSTYRTNLWKDIVHNGMIRKDYVNGDLVNTVKTDREYFLKIIKEHNESRFKIPNHATCGDMIMFVQLEIILKISKTFWKFDL